MSSHDGESALWVLRQILADLPERRDWLDPRLERVARDLVKANKYADLGEPQSCTEPDGCPTEKAVLQRFWRDHSGIRRNPLEWSADNENEAKQP